MKNFISVPCDLYVLKSDIIRMEKYGESAIGYISVENPEEYELVSKYAFQQVSEDDIIDENSYDVVFIYK